MQDINIFDLSSHNVGMLPLHIGELKLSYFSGKKSNPHWDEDPEAIFVREGSLIVVVNGEHIPLHTGEMLILGPKAVHYFTSKDGKDCTFISALVAESLFSSTPAIQEKYLEPIFHSYHENHVIIRKDFPQYAKIHFLLHDLMELVRKEEPGYEMLVVARIHEFLGLLYQPLADSFFLFYNADTPENKRFRDMVDYLYDNYQEKILAEEIAQAGNVSRKTCYNLFHKFTGKTPLEFLLAYRLNKAKVLLKETDKSISEIANDTGFSHQSHFTLQFDRAFHITPLKYRMHSRSDYRD